MTMQEDNLHMGGKWPGSNEFSWNGLSWNYYRKDLH